MLALAVRRGFLARQIPQAPQGPVGVVRRRGRISFLMVTVAVALGLSACSSNPAAPSVRTQGSPTESASSVARGDMSEQPSASALRHVGGFKYAYVVASVTEDLDVSRISVGSAAAPPPEVLAACKGIPNVPAWDTETSAFASAQVTISYTGAIATRLILGLADGLNPAYRNLFQSTAVQLPEGSWACGTATLTNVQPGQQLTLPVWFIMGNVITNAHPQLTEDEKAVWGWRGFGGDLDGVLPTSMSAFGAGAAECSLRSNGMHSGGQTLLARGLTLLAQGTPPTVYDYPDGRSASCSALSTS